MPECIFCRKIKDEKMFNAEHIILDSLGGKGEENVCRNVCIECNSTLGTRVDAGMVNETITKYMRYLFKIKGRTGIPNPFKNIKINYANSQIKGELKTNKDGEISGFVADHQVIEEQGKILIVGPRCGFGGYAKSVMQKTYGEEISEDDVKNKGVFFDTSLVPRIKFVKISEEAMADYQVKVVPVMLKMAYEFCFVKLGDAYLDDAAAVEIREFLMKFDYKKDKFYYMPTDAEVDMKDIDANKENIIELSMYIEAKRLYVYINLYGFFKCKLCMSHSAEKFGEFETYTLKVTV